MKEGANEKREQGGTERNRKKIDNKRDGCEKDGPGPVMVSDNLCPAVHILGT